MGASEVIMFGRILLVAFAAIAAALYVPAFGPTRV